MGEVYIENDELMPEKAWKEIIDSLATGENIKDKKKAKDIIKKEVLNAIKSRIPKERFGIMFSGGLDSSIITFVCKQLKADFVCYCVGFYDEGQKYPEDLVFAEKLAAELDVKLKIVLLDFKQSERIIKKTVKILKSDLNNVVNIGVGSVLLASLEAAKKDDIKILFSGLGAEEIFAGYERHIQYDKKDYEHAQNECWKGLLGMHQRDFLRDFQIAKHFKAELRTPFMDLELIKKSMRVPGELKINKNHKKIILREVAEELGLDKEYAWRKKLASQYGSRINKAIQKLARRAGFKYKKDYLKSLE